MSRLERLRSLVTQRMNAAADDIGRILEGKVAEYEEEVRFFREENNSLQHKILQIASKSDVQIVVMDDDEASPSENHDDSPLDDSPLDDSPLDDSPLDDSPLDEGSDEEGSDEEGSDGEGSDEEGSDAGSDCEDEEDEAPPEQTSRGRKSDAAKDGETPATSPDTETDAPRRSAKRRSTQPNESKAKKSKN